MSGALIIASERGEVGLAEAMERLRSRGSAMDAVEIAVRAAEANLEDHYVGVGGIPNVLGEVELDASIMDGRTRAAGAVGAVHGYPHPITIARAVLEHLPQHVMLVGDGAERFAADMGIPQGETLTEEAQRIWREGVQDGADGNSPADGDGERRYREAAVSLLARMSPHDGPWGTVNVIARDRDGQPVRWRQHQRLSLEAPGPAGRLAGDRRRQLLRQPARRRRLHGPWRAGDQGCLRAFCRLASGDGGRARRGGAGGAPRDRGHARRLPLRPLDAGCRAGRPARRRLDEAGRHLLDDGRADERAGGLRARPARGLAGSALGGAPGRVAAQAMMRLVPAARSEEIWRKIPTSLDGSGSA